METETGVLLKRSILWNLMLPVGYMALLTGCIVALRLLPAVTLSADWYFSLYSSNELSLFYVCYYSILMLTGYTYKIVFVLKSKRKWVLSSRYGHFSGFLMYVGIALILYWVGPNFLWPAYSLIYILVFLTLPYVLCLYFSKLDKGVLRKLEFSTDGLQSMSCAVLLLLVLTLVLLASTCGYQFFLLYQLGLLYMYLIPYSCLLSFLALLTYLLRRTHNLHIHHYMIGFLLLPLTRPNSVVSLVVQGVALGLYTEGIARWGFGYLFKPKRR